MSNVDIDFLERNILLAYYVRKNHQGKFLHIGNWGLSPALTFVREKECSQTERNISSTSLQIHGFDAPLIHFSFTPNSILLFSTKENRHTIIWRLWNNCHAATWSEARDCARSQQSAGLGHGYQGGFLGPGQETWDHDNVGNGHGRLPNTFILVEETLP